MRISDWSSDVCSSDLRLALELDRSALDSPVFKAMLAFAGLDIEQALANDLPGERVSLSWAMPGTTLVLPGAAALRSAAVKRSVRSEEHTSELQSLMRNSYAVFCLKKKTTTAFSLQYNSHSKLKTLLSNHKL